VADDSGTALGGMAVAGVIDGAIMSRRYGVAIKEVPLDIVDGRLRRVDTVGIVGGAK
jgi:hypothetical protein